MSDQKLVLGLRLKVALVLGYAGAAAVLIAALVFAFEPLALLWLTPRRLPGFTVSLPSGQSDGEPSLYATGRVRVQTTVLPAIVYVRWDPHDAEPRELEERFTEAARREGGRLERTEMTVRGRGSVVVWHLEAAALRDQAWISVIECGSRQLRVTTSSVGVRGGEGLHRRIVRSVRCEAEAAEEARLGDVPLVLKQLPPGYTRTKAPVGDLQLVSSRHALLAHLVSGRMSPVAAAKAIETLGILAPGVHVGDRDGNQFELASDAGNMFGWFSTLPCRASDASVWLITLSQVSRDDARLALDVHRQARCREPGETAQEWPQ